MSTLYKTRELDSKSDAVIHRETSADIVKFNPDGLENLLDEDTQGAIATLNTKVEDRVTSLDFANEIEEFNQKISSVTENANGRATTVTYYATIIAKNFAFSNDMYTQDVEIEGVLATDKPIIGLIEVDGLYAALDQQEAWSNINRIVCHDGYISIYCYEDVPRVDMNVQIMIIR